MFLFFQNPIFKMLYITQNNKNFKKKFKKMFFKKKCRSVSMGQRFRVRRTNQRRQGDKAEEILQHQVLFKRAQSFFVFLLR